MSIAKNHGAVLLGALVATFLSGMSTVQTVIYFRLYQKDPIILKTSVISTWSLDVIHTAFIWVVLWSTFIESFGQESEIDVIQKERSPEFVIITTIMTLIVQIFYLYRIFRVSGRNYWIIMPIFIMVICRTGGGIASTVALSRFQTLQQFATSSYGWLLSFSLSFAAATDIAIMAIMFVLLRSGRQQSISLKNVIDQIILYTLEMGSLAALTAIATSITWFTGRGTLVFLAFYLFFAKVYAITLLGSLNARHQLRQAQNVQNSQGLGLNRVAVITNN